ncbi:hypothetical protein DRP05_10990 [Archaeoglobales archaeon]|nr:MAG: hypothetical protein DRP05_10990 [Archaeoglobales archaeon]
MINNQIIFFERTICISRSADGRIEEHEKTWRAAYRIDKNWESYSGLNWKEMTQFNNLVSHILPKGIRSFFFFDGERLDNFFRKGMEYEIKNAIMKVCQIELLDRCIDHLTTKFKELQRNIKGTTPDTDRISKEIEILSQSKEDLESEIEKLSKKIEEAQRNKEDIEEKLRNYTRFNVQDLQSERDWLESEVDKLDEKIGKKEKEVKRHFISGIIFLLGYDALKKTYELIDRKIKGVDQPPIPPDIKDKFLKDLLMHRRCICGTELSEGSLQRKAIEKLLNSIEPLSRISDEAMDGYYKISNILDEYKRFTSKRKELEEEYRELIKERKEKSQRLKEISEKLKGIPVEEIQNLENLRNSFEDEIRKCIAERSQKELQLKGVEDRIKIKNKELLKEIEKDKKQRKLRLKLELCEKSIEELKNIKEEVARSVREEVEQKTKEYFLTLHWKKGAFKDIKINDNYEISVISRLGTECLGTLSAGERQILALSFMAALSSVSGFEAPVIIDTPLGRISGEPKEKIAKSLPKYLQKTQLTLLITDQEYTSTVRDNMKERIGKEFELRYNEDEIATEIIEIRGG